MSKKLKMDRQLKSSNFCIPPPHTPPPPMTETCVFRNMLGPAAVRKTRILLLFF